MASPRFPPPWTVHKAERGYRVATRPAKPSRSKGLTWDEARRIAAGIARLPELMAPRSRAGAADN